MTTPQVVRSAAWWRTHRGFGAVVVAIVGSAYPAVSQRSAALVGTVYGPLTPVEWSRVAVLWAISFGLVVVCSVILHWLTRLEGAQALLPGVLITWGLAFFGRIGDAIESLPAVNTAGGAIAATALVGCGAWAAVRIAQAQEGFGALLIAILIPLALAAWQSTGLFRIPQPTAVSLEDIAVPSSGSVWILVFDALPSPEILDVIGYDSAELVAPLQENGFTVAVSGVTHSTRTYTALAPALLLAPDPPPTEIEAAEQGGWLAAMQGEHPLTIAMADAGREIVMVENAWTFTRCGQLVDTCLTTARITEIEYLALVNSIASLWLPDVDYRVAHSLRQLDQLDQLAQQPTTQPRVVYAHLLLPHEPYDIDGRCRPLESAHRARSDGFVASTSCVARRLAALVGAIPSDDTVLIIGDHGSDLYGEISNLSARDLRDRTSAFIAIRGCEVSAVDLTSNVNAYRATAECVLGGSFPPWPPVPHLACYEESPRMRIVPADRALAQQTGLACADS